MDHDTLGPGGVDRWLTDRFGDILEDPEWSGTFTDPPELPIITDDDLTGRASFVDQRDDRSKARHRTLETFCTHLWKLLSEEGEVTTATGHRLDLGTHRMAGAVLAGWANRLIDEWRFMDDVFYLGGLMMEMVGQEPPRSRVRIAWILKRLAHHGDRWQSRGGDHWPARLDEVAARSGPATDGQSLCDILEELRRDRDPEERR